MILSDKDVLKLIEEGRLVISPFSKENLIESGHVNLHLASGLLKYKEGILDLSREAPHPTEELILSRSGYVLQPGEFLLGSTVEKITIPDDHFGFIETKGNIARAGIQAHNADGHIDPGFSGTVTLEIKNNAQHAIKIYAGLPFVQFYIFQLTSKARKPYHGKYQNQQKATVYKKDL